jgi:hypothetical protein
VSTAASKLMLEMRAKVSGARDYAAGKRTGVYPSVPVSDEGKLLLKLAARIRSRPRAKRGVPR